MQLADRLDQLPPYLFLEISRKIQEKRAEGADVVSFGIATPTSQRRSTIVDALTRTAHDPPNHRYPESDGLPVLREAIAGWYERRFGLRFDPGKEVLPLIGAKEGIGHMALCLIDPGDVALVPDPGYPVYSVGTMFAGGVSHVMALTEEHGWLPDLSAIPDDVAQRATIMWLNYPNNPTGALADPAFFEEAVAFAKRYDIAICHDAAYSEVTFDGYRAPSFLETPGAMDVGIEFHSWSKTYNMTGCASAWPWATPRSSTHCSGSSPTSTPASLRPCSTWVSRRWRTPPTSGSPPTTMSTAGVATAWWRCSRAWASP